MSVGKQKFQSPERIVSYLAGFLAISSSIVVLLLGYTPRSSHPFNAIYPILILTIGTGCSFGIFLSMLFILRTAKLNRENLLHLGIFAFTAALPMLQLLVMRMSINSGLAYTIYAYLLVILYIIVAEQMTQLFVSSLRERLSIALLYGVFGLSCCTWQIKDLKFQGIEKPSLTLAIAVSLSLILHPLLLMGMRLIESKKTDQSMSNEVRRLLRIFANRSPRFMRLYVSLWLTALAYGLILLWLRTAMAPENPQHPWLGSGLIFGCINFLWVPCLYYVYKNWHEAILTPRSIRSSSSQGSRRAKEFIKQHHLHRGSSETWVGLRTATIMIDHDPHEECRTKLPGLLTRARQLQCEQILNRIFYDQILSSQSHGSQLQLSIHPENSIASCTDSLLILTVFYLDGLPLVEKRLKQLVRLLPLLDPELAKLLSESRLEHLFSHVQSFFHLDFNWIDQYVQDDSGEANFEVRLENLNPKERHQVLNQLSESQWLGNFIWISESAKDRLSAESPFLAGAIERWPIQVEQVQGRSIDTVIYLIKFENLIPRLQRYHALDEIRKQIEPLPINDATANLHDRIQQNISSLVDQNSLRNFLREIEMHQWVGFRAKDMGLDLLMKLSGKLDELEYQTRIDHAEWQKIRSEIKNLVQEIGYPSQELHQAHISKWALRHLDELQSICLDSKHPRCREAWLLLAGLPTRGLSTDAIQQMLLSIVTVCQTPKLFRQPIILQKTVEAFFHLARPLPRSSDAEIQRIFEIIAGVLIQMSHNPSVLIAFIDGKYAMEQLRAMDLNFSQALYKTWDYLIRDMIEKGNMPSSQLAGLEIRWRGFSEKYRKNLSKAG